MRNISEVTEGVQASAYNLTFCLTFNLLSFHYALSDIWDGAFCRGISGLELSTVFCQECSKVCSGPTGAFKVELFQMLHWALSMSQEAGSCKISITTINCRT